jgi:hypothetical protein
MSASNHFLPSSLRLLSTQSCHYGANVCFRPKADTWERRTKGALSITALALYRPAPLPMRRLHLIKPPNGWPDFINELVIVVLGVLIALGAQELLNKWNARRDLDEFRSAVDQEIADNLAARLTKKLPTTLQLMSSECGNLPARELGLTNSRRGKRPGGRARVQRC